MPIPRPKALTWLIVRHKEELDDDEQYLLKLLLRDSEIAELRQIAHKFMQMIRNQSADDGIPG
jgi:hypothetical protein